MIVLGLDQSSTNIGFAYGAPGGTPQWGCYEVPDYGGHEGRTFWAIVDWLVNVIKCQGVDYVYWEGVYVPPQAMVDTNKLFKLFSAANAVQAACVYAARGIEVHDAYVVISSWRSHFLGTGGAPKAVRDKRKWLKDAVLRACVDRGWLIDNEHAAEACGIWDYGCTLCDKSYRFASGGELRRRQAKAAAVGA